MLYFVFWCLVMIGFTQIVCVSLIMKPFREWARWPEMVRKMLRCPLCLGTWTGFGFSYLGLSLAANLVHWPWGAHAYLDALAASAVCWTAHVIFNALGASKL